MALLVASMCDRATFQTATKEFADEILSTGAPLHTLAMLFSGQLQPPSDSSLDRSGAKPSFWDNSAHLLRLPWRQHLAATISNRTLGWDRIVLSLGDHLVDLGCIDAAHFCFMVSGCPVTSLLHPSSRISLVGCDHFVPMDAAMMTSEGISSYERTEAIEWAKRRGNPNAAIPSLQPFKLLYAMLLTDMGFETEAREYVKSIRQCCGLETKKGRLSYSGPSTVWAFSVRDNFEDAMNEFEDRLCQGKLRARSMSRRASDRGGRKTAEVQPSGASGEEPPSKVKVRRSRGTKGSRSPTRTRSKRISPKRGSGPSEKPMTRPEPKVPSENEDVNATFLSAQSNLLDVTSTSVEPSQRGDRHQAFVAAASAERKVEKEPAIIAPSVTSTSLEESRKADVAKKTPSRKKVTPPPNSAPALLGSTKKDWSVGASPQKAPSSDKSKLHIAPDSLDY